ncbi:MAG TPA: NfeD family protein [Bacteroidales bacterium]|nr:NfeD family protein [Bacteroidales bacterium]
MWTIILVLIATGLLMILLEILVIPGGGLAGIVGFALMVAGVWLAFSREGSEAGLYTLGGTIVINVVVLTLALRSRTWDRAMLKSNIDSKVNVVDTDHIKPGDTGTTISRCVPSGKALINGQIYEVHARSEYIEVDTEIEVIKVEGYKIYIKSKN